MEEQMKQTQTAEMIAAAESDTVMDEHRAALAKMRTAYALEQLYAASGARDPGMLGRLIDVEPNDVIIGEDGVPDVSAVKEKIDTLRRDSAYLFEETGGAGKVFGSNDSGASAPRLGVIPQTALSELDDASYYRALLSRKRSGRR